MHITILPALTGQTGTKNAAPVNGQSLNVTKTGNSATFLSAFQGGADHNEETESDAPKGNGAKAEGEPHPESDAKGATADQVKSNQADFSFDGDLATSDLNDTVGPSNTNTTSGTDKVSNMLLDGRKAGAKQVFHPGSAVSDSSSSSDNARATQSLPANQAALDKHPSPSLVSGGLSVSTESVVHIATTGDAAGTPTSNPSSPNITPARPELTRGATAQQFVTAAMAKNMDDQNGSAARLAITENHDSQFDLSQIQTVRTKNGALAHDATQNSGQIAKASGQPDKSMTFIPAPVPMPKSPTDPSSLGLTQMSAFSGSQTNRVRAPTELADIDPRLPSEAIYNSVRLPPSDRADQTAHSFVTATLQLPKASTEASQFADNKLVAHFGHSPGGSTQLEHDVPSTLASAPSFVKSHQNSGIALPNGPVTLNNIQAATQHAQFASPPSTSASAPYVSGRRDLESSHNLQPMLSQQPTQTAPIKTANMLKPPVAMGQASNVTLSSTPLGYSEPADEIFWDLRPQNSTATQLSSNAAMLRTEIPNHVAQQLVQAMHRQPERTVEIALNPAELGRVRMKLSTTETGIVVSILADRPETLDLMRRNINDLGESFADLGYDDIAFAFGQNETPTDASQDDQSDHAASSAIDLDEQPSSKIEPLDTPRLILSGDGIDLRL